MTSTSTQRDAAQTPQRKLTAGGIQTCAFKTGPHQIKTQSKCKPVASWANVAEKRAGRNTDFLHETASFSCWKVGDLCASFRTTERISLWSRWCETVMLASCIHFSTFLLNIPWTLHLIIFSISILCRFYGFFRLLNTTWGSGLCRSTCCIFLLF